MSRAWYRTVGYMVLDEEGQPRCHSAACDYLYRPAWRGHASVFPTRKAADAAIDATWRYTQERGWDWHVDRWRILRVAEAAPAVGEPDRSGGA